MRLRRVRRRVRVASGRLTYADVSLPDGREWKLSCVAKGRFIGGDQVVSCLYKKKQNIMSARSTST